MRDERSQRHIPETRRIDRQPPAAESPTKQAKGDDSRYEALEYRHDQFDMADALCSIALALSAVAALAGRKHLLYGAWGAGALGAIMGIAGIAGWNIHPEWLASFLG